MRRRWRRFRSAAMCRSKKKVCPDRTRRTRHRNDGTVFPGNHRRRVYRQDGRRSWTKSKKAKETGSKCLKNFTKRFEKRLKVAEEEMKQVEIQDEVSDETCEKCGKPMVYKMGRFGKFLACSGFPDCRNTKPIVMDTGVACPKCDEGTDRGTTQQERAYFLRLRPLPGMRFRLLGQTGRKSRARMRQSLMVEKSEPQRQYESADVRVQLITEEADRIRGQIRMSPPHAC